MPFRVMLSDDAARDIEDLYRYVARADSPERAEQLPDALEQAVLGLSELPERGNVPKELQSLGLSEFREVHYKPYRVIYRIQAEIVTVYCVADGRRDMQGLLQRRLLR